MLVWRPGEVPPAPRSRRDGNTPRPIQVKTLAKELAADAWQTISWREGSNTTLTLRFVRLRVRPAHAAEKHGEAAAEQWLLIEWPQGESEPDHYWLSTRLADICFEQLVDQAKLPPASAGAWLADRARLSRPQARGRPRSLRRPRLARLPPSCQPLHPAYGLLVSERETLLPQDLPAPGAARDLPFRRLSTQRRYRYAHSATCRTRSTRFASVWLASCSRPCRDVLAAGKPARDAMCEMSDTVGLVNAASSAPI
jgi:hypothetical protein